MVSEKAKKLRSKPSRDRPIATSTIMQPVVQDTTFLTNLSAFSPQRNLFAYLSLAVDKDILRVYDTGSGRSVAEQVVDSARVTCLTWNTIYVSGGQHQGEDGLETPAKKRRKKRKSQADLNEGASATECVLMGLSDGSIIFFTPSHGRIMRQLTHSSSNSSILSIIHVKSLESTSLLYTSCADGAILLWNVSEGDVVKTWRTEDRIPYSSMAIRPGHQDTDNLQLLVASHTIRLLSIAASQNVTDILETQKPVELAFFTGHASSIKDLQWDVSQEPSIRFFSMAESDRFVYIWELPDTQNSTSKEGRIVTSIPLDADARGFSLSHSSRLLSQTKQNLLTLSSSGRISIYPIPELAQPARTNQSKPKVPTLVPRSNISSSSKSSRPTHVINATFVEDGEGNVRVARLVAGVQPVFDSLKYLDDSGNFIQNINIPTTPSQLRQSSTEDAPANKRYTESSSLAVRSGTELAQDEDLDELPPGDIDGDLDTELADLSLGQRLAALSGGDQLLDRSSASESDDASSKKKPKSPRKLSKQQELSVVPAKSLARTLIQALHSSDSGLLETCLNYSNQDLIRNTVQKLPPQLAVPLLTACVERLGRGARAANMKGGGGGASSQRGTALIAWIKTVLVVHGGHLMSMPDLVARLSGLHAVLTTRLTLQDSLLTLSGRLEMMLSQIEMRSSTAPAPLASQKRGKSSEGRTARKYVEGESEEEEDDKMEVEVEVDSGNEGSIENVELGGDEDEDDEEDGALATDDDESSLMDDEDESEEETQLMNGFIDDEAEEDYEDEDESE